MDKIIIAIFLIAVVMPLTSQAQQRKAPQHDFTTLQSKQFSKAFFEDEEQKNKRKNHIVTGLVIGSFVGFTTAFIIAKKNKTPITVPGLILVGGVPGGILGSIIGVITNSNNK